MNVYLAMSRARQAAAAELQMTMLGRGLCPVSTWPLEVEATGRASARAAMDAADRQLASAAALFVVAYPGDDDPELFIRVGQAIELHMPIVWAAPNAVDALRVGFRVVPSQAGGLDMLESWKRRLSGGIGEEHARRALWVMLQADEAREADRASASP